MLPTTAALEDHDISFGGGGGERSGGRRRRRAGEDDKDETKRTVKRRRRRRRRRRELCFIVSFAYYSYACIFNKIDERKEVSLLGRKKQTLSTRKLLLPSGSPGSAFRLVFVLLSHRCCASLRYAGERTTTASFALFAAAAKTDVVVFERRRR